MATAKSSVVKSEDEHGEGGGDLSKNKRRTKETARMHTQKKAGGCRPFHSSVVKLPAKAMPRQGVRWGGLSPAGLLSARRPRIGVRFGSDLHRWRDRILAPQQVAVHRTEIIQTCPMTGRTSLSEGALLFGHHETSWFGFVRAQRAYPQNMVC